MLPLCFADVLANANIAQLIISMIKEESASCQKVYVNIDK